MLFNLYFANNTVLSCFFFFFLIIYFYFLIAAVIAQSFDPNVELVISIGILTKEAKAEMETHSVIVEAQIRKCSTELRVVQTFLCFLLINSFRFISSIK